MHGYIYMVEVASITGTNYCPDACLFLGTCYRYCHVYMKSSCVGRWQVEKIVSLVAGLQSFSVISQLLFISQLFLTYFPKISQLFLSYFPFLAYFLVVSHLFLTYFSTTSSVISHLLLKYCSLVPHLAISHLCFFCLCKLFTT